MKKIYLAGPIAGLTYQGAEDWRTYVRNTLHDYKIAAFSPLRAKSFLANHGVLTNQPYTEHPLATARGILTRDHLDCKTSDLIFCNLLGATTVSIGTVMEIAFAHAYGKPLVVAMEPEGNVHEHAMLSQAIDFRVTSLDEAIDLTISILNP